MWWKFGEKKRTPTKCHGGGVDRNKIEGLVSNGWDDSSRNLRVGMKSRMLRKYGGKRSGTLIGGLKKRPRRNYVVEFWEEKFGVHDYHGERSCSKKASVLQSDE